MLAPIVITLKYLNNNLNINYIMTDGGCLPMGFSDTVRRLKDDKLLNNTITIGHAFGGDLEAVNIYNGLIASKEILKSDITIISMGPGIVGTGTWSKLGITKNRYINEIIVHCSATAEGKDFTVSDIKKWHIARGFSDIGYHYIIYRDGSINKGRDESKIGAHCTGHNSNSIGVCYIGGCAADGKTPKDTRTEAQKNSLLKLLRELKNKYPKVSIHSHKDFANKACPSFDATKEYSSL